MMEEIPEAGLDRIRFQPAFYDRGGGMYAYYGFLHENAAACSSTRGVGQVSYCRANLYGSNDLPAFPFQREVWYGGKEGGAAPCPRMQ